MKILIERPPIYDNLSLVFPLHRGIIFAYGEDIYNPDDVRVSEDLIVHESVHIKQQKELGPDIWWSKYMRDTDFRLSQEIEAYAEQYNFICRKEQNKQKRFEILKRMAEILSSATYGKCIGLGNALLKIKEKSNDITK